MEFAEGFFIFHKTMKRSKNKQKLNKEISKKELFTQFNFFEDTENQWEKIFEILEEMGIEEITIKN